MCLKSLNLIFRNFTLSVSRFITRMLPALHTPSHTFPTSHDDLEPFGPVCIYSVTIYHLYNDQFVRIVTFYYHSKISQGQTIKLV